MTPLEVSTLVSNIVSSISQMILVGIAIYGVCSWKIWLKQNVTNRRADLAKEMLAELEYFHLRLEQLIQWHWMLDWKEWGSSFNEVLRAHFLLAKIKAANLKNVEISSCLDEMEQILKNLPGNQRLSTQLVEGTGELFWRKEAPKA